MFPLASNFDFWIAIFVAGVVTMLVMRRHVRSRMTDAPEASFRSRKQRGMHYVSIILITVPLGYVALVNGAPFWAAFWVLGVQAGVLAVLRSWDVGYVARALMIGPIAAVSVLVGALVEVWPASGLSALSNASWAFLVLCGISLALSSAFSMYSFPLGFGERAQ